MLTILPEVDDDDELAEAATNNLELLKQKDEAEGISVIENFTQDTIMILIFGKGTQKNSSLQSFQSFTRIGQHNIHILDDPNNKYLNGS